MLSPQPLAPSPAYVSRVYLSYSTLLTFIRCPRKYFYQKSGIYPREESNALLYGTAMHKAVALASEGNFAAALAAFNSVWTEEVDATQSDPKRSRARAHQQLSHFCHTHRDGRSIYRMQPPPATSLLRTSDRSPYEIEFVIDVGLPVPIYGFLDGWCQHRDTGEYYAYEFKSSSRLNASLFDGLDFNPQILTYALVCRTMVEQPIKGVMFEAMLIDAKKVDNMAHPVPVQNFQVDAIHLWLRYWGELLLACEAEYAELLTVYGIEEVRAQMRKESFVPSLDPSQAFPKNFAGCTAYPLFYQSGSACEYMNLCRVAEWRNMLPFYEVHPEEPKVSLTHETKPVKVQT